MPRRRVGFSSISEKPAVFNTEDRKSTLVQNILTPPLWEYHIRGIKLFLNLLQAMLDMSGFYQFYCIPVKGCSSYNRLCIYIRFQGACDRVVCWGTILQSRRSRVLFPRSLLDFFNLPNPSSLIMSLASTRPLTETSTRKLPVGKGRPSHKADNIYKPTV
jgi:hypothetical protein